MNGSKQMAAALSAMVVMISLVVLVCPVSDADDTGTITVNGEISTSSLEEVLTSYSNGFDIVMNIVLSSGTYTISSVININKVNENTSKSISITGAGADSTKIVFEGSSRIVFYYNDGVNVSLEGITFDCGTNTGGTIEWESVMGYMTNADPSDTPSFSVSACIFESGKTGIGIWDDNGHTLQTAKSDISITDCEFRDLGAGIYMSEESPLLNANLLLKDCRFSDIGWGIMGSPVNAHIIHNDFDSTCRTAIQFIINKELKTAGTGTVIEKNVIDSVRGIEIMPYHLNQNNGLGDSETIIVTEDMLPTISGNNRDTDEYIVTTVLYRGPSDEVLRIENGALNLDGNYTAGRTPAANTQFNNTATNNFSDITDKDSILSDFDNCVEVNDFPTTPNHDAGVGGEIEVPPEVPPVTPSIPDDEDDELPFIPGNNTSQDPSDDDKTTLVAAAAAVVVIMLAVVAIMVTRNH